MNKVNLKVLGVRKDDKKKEKIKLHPNLPDFNTPRVILCLSSRNSGKTNLCCNMLLRKDWGMCDCIDQVFIISPTINNCQTIKPLVKRWEGNCFSNYSDDIINDIVNYQKSLCDEDRKHVCIFWDDAVQGNRVRLNKFHLLNTYNRHMNCSTISNFQMLKACPKILRNNATDIFLFKCRSEKERYEQYLEYGSLRYSKDDYYRLFDYATSKPYSFLYVKLEGKNAPQYFRNFEENITYKFNNKYGENETKEESSGEESEEIEEEEEEEKENI